MSLDRLRADLDHAAAAAGRTLDAARRRAALPAAVLEGAWVALGVAAVLFLYRATAGRGSAWLFAFVVVLAGGTWVAWRVAVARRRRADRIAALRRADAEVGGAERLLAADEFLRREARTPFMAAALEDALPHAARARDATYAEDAAPRAWPRPAWVALAAAVLLVAGAALLPYRAPAAANARDAEARRPVAEDAARRDPVAEPEPARRNPAPRRSDPDAPLAPDDAPAGAADRYSSDDAEPTRGTDAMSRAGQSAQGGAPTRAADARGAPSDMAQTTEPTERKPEPKKTRKKRDTEAPAARKKRRPERNAGATTGRGASSSSSRNPTSSTWATKDRVPDAQEEPVGNDEEVEDEEEDQEARGGIQPNLRDRKPPVNRDLSIGFGTRTSPDANGRGGPSQRKKSRGTASLVLGVPIPDHIKGQPNPGMTKVTQERVEPKAERSEPRVAEARAPRAGPVGHVAQPRLPPWLKRMVRTYFEKESK